ncbi:MAG: hypothetical protein EXS36_07265 [Pedosphaera sp.]|nr:hypothetical protein [Pedosphaera sp.]
MTAAPLIRRELYTAARRGRNQRVRWWISALGLVGLSLFLFTLMTGTALPVTGRVIFQSIGTWIYYYCLVAGAVVAADAISSERREGTLGLLFLTDLTGWDVVGGKLTTALLPILYAVMGLVPMLSVLILAGGVTLGDLGRVAGICLTAVVFSGSIGLFCSSLSLNERKSAFAALVITLSVTELLHGAATVLGLHVRSGTPEEPAHRWFEMVLPWAEYLDQWTLPFLRDEATRPAIRKVLFNFETRIGGHWLAAGVLLGFASHFARKAATGLARNRFGEWIWHLGNRWTYGSGANRERRRRRLLDVDAITWLCLRHARKGAYGWIFVGAILLVVMAVESQMPGFVWPWIFLSGFLGMVHAVFKAWIASETCHQIVEDRRSGALELILSTPVDVLQIAKGHFRSHRQQLLMPIVALLIGEFGWVFRMSAKRKAVRSRSGDDSLRNLPGHVVSGYLGSPMAGALVRVDQAHGERRRSGVHAVDLPPPDSPIFADGRIARGVVPRGLRFPRFGNRPDRTVVDCTGCNDQHTDGALGQGAISQIHATRRFRRSGHPENWRSRRWQTPIVKSADRAAGAGEGIGA